MAKSGRSAATACGCRNPCTGSIALPGLVMRAAEQPMLCAPIVSHTCAATMQIAAGGVEQRLIDIEHTDRRRHSAAALWRGQNIVSHVAHMFSHKFSSRAGLTPTVCTPIRTLCGVFNYRTSDLGQLETSESN